MVRHALEWGGEEAGVGMAGEDGLDPAGRSQAPGDDTGDARGPRDAGDRGPRATGEAAPAERQDVPDAPTGPAAPSGSSAYGEPPGYSAHGQSSASFGYGESSASFGYGASSASVAGGSPEPSGPPGPPVVPGGPAGPAGPASVDAERVETLPPTSPAEHAPATPLGSRYMLESVIGSGATGRVWRGRRRDDGAAVAVKMLRGDFTDDPDAVVRFLRQRTVLVTLDHPHLVRVHDLVAEGEVLAIVMDLVDGEDLRRLAARRALRTDQQLTLVAQVASALTAVHSVGVVHRDIKPENILVTWRNAEPYALLTDFGLARITDAPSLTRMSQLVGTPAYIAPELVESRPAGPPSDVYSLGVTLYELLAGQRPFHAESLAALLRAHLDTEPVRPPGLPDRLWALVRACLAKDPAARPGTALLAEHLRALGEQAQVPPQPIPPPPPGGVPQEPAGGPGPTPGDPAPYPQSGYSPAGHPQAGYPQPDYAQPGYPQPGYTAAGYPQAGYPQSGPEAGHIPPTGAGPPGGGGRQPGGGGMLTGGAAQPGGGLPGGAHPPGGAPGAGGPAPPGAPGTGGPAPPGGAPVFYPAGPSAGHAAPGAGDVAVPQPTTGATRPAQPPPARPAPPPRRRTSLWIALAACVLLGTGAGLWFGRPDERPQPPPVAKSSPPPYKLMYLPVTAISPRPGTIRLDFPDSTNTPGFRLYVIFRDRDKIAEEPSGRVPPYHVYSVDRRTEHCWTVAALVETDQPPPSAAAKPACKVADGRASEN
jgi:hypothetical protein